MFGSNLCVYLKLGYAHKSVALAETAFTRCMPRSGHQRLPEKLALWWYAYKSVESLGARGGIRADLRPSLVYVHRLGSYTPGGLAVSQSDVGD